MNNPVSHNPVKVSIRHLYKIFGDRPSAVLPGVLAGMGKAELLAQHNHVLGLRDINVDIREGEITVIMGLSGSGKSTLIRHLNRLIEPTSGEVLVDGENILRWNADQLRGLRRKTMSMVFQKFALLPHRTVLDNAGMALETQGQSRRDYEAEAQKWLARVGLGAYGAHALATLPADLASLWNTASLFHLVHAAALVGVASFASMRPDRTPFSIAFALLILGTLLFSGSLYLRALTDFSFGTVTPIGGIALIAGWLAFAAAAFRR